MYVCVCVCVGLEISGFASPNVNQYQAKCKPLPPNNSPRE